MTLMLLATAFTLTYSQTKSINAVKIPTGKIVIDGIPDREILLNCQSAREFTEWDPNPGKKEKDRTEVRIVYDDIALYVIAEMHLDQTKMISQILTERDDAGVSDYFIFNFDPFGDNALSYNFGVTAAGVQFDFKLSENGEDFNWNEVWKSKINITDSSWIAELQIPYSAIRFPKKNTGERKVNFIRHINDGRTKLSWSPIEPTENNLNMSNGTLNGFEISSTPVRLSLSPYISAYVEKKSGLPGISWYVKGGADLKYGINESFTLDMMLIPDFGQVRSDDYSLNLSPYEIYYDERRSFFKEGTELFERAGIFYSRRIGGNPLNFYTLNEEMTENEIITSNPSELQLLNAFKVSGKTKKGTSLGFLNALSLKSEAVLEDTVTGEERTFITQSFTNYNVAAFEQSLKHNSYVSFVNTNMLIPNSDFMANVTGTDFKLAEKRNTYAFFAKGAYSYNKLIQDSSNNGFYSDFSFEKIKGKFKFQIGNSLLNDTYNPNYMGYLQSNNEIVNEAVISYTFFNPVKKILRLNTEMRYAHNTFFKPRHMLSSEININIYALTQKNLSLWINTGGELGNSYNFNETRTTDRYFQQLRTNYYILGFSSNYAKPFALDMQGTYWDNTDKEQFGYGLNISPRFQLGKSFMLILMCDYSTNKFFGYTGTNGNDIQFGLRLRQDIQNVVDAKYIFNNKSSLSLRISHINSKVNYAGSYILDSDGFPQLADFELEPLDFNMLNSYLNYQLEFAPGSFLSLTWKNELLKTDTEPADHYFQSLKETLNDHPNNNLSVRLILYLNYFTLKNKFKAYE
jgi:hypothetical protein